MDLMTSRTSVIPSVMRNETCMVTVAALFSALVSKNFKKNSFTDIFNLSANNRYDFVVVGGGTAGAVVASRLSEEKDWSVLLLEAGSEEPEQFQIPALVNYASSEEYEWNFKTESTENICGGKECIIRSGKVLGGSSVINDMKYMRGSKEDYDDWKFMGNYGWGYEDVLEYFKMSETNKDYGENSDFHGTKGPLSVQNFPYQDSNIQRLIGLFERMGLEEKDLSTNDSVGVTKFQMTSRDGKRDSSNSAYLKFQRNSRTNLVIKTEAIVNRVLIDRSTMQARGVEYRHKGIVRTVYANKEIILSAGVVNTPKILMLSGIGPEGILNKTRINIIRHLTVGKNFQSHVTTSAIKFLLSNETSQIPRTLEKYSEHISKYLFSEGPLSATGINSVGVFLKTKFSVNYESVPDLFLTFNGDVISATNNVKINTSLCASLNQTHTLPICYYDAFYVYPRVAKPKSIGSVVLNISHPTADPIIFANYLSDSYDFQILMEGVFLLRNLTHTNMFSEAGFSLISPLIKDCPFEFDSEKYWRCVSMKFAIPTHDACCTCKMGPSYDPEAVVDPELKVHGIERLRVIDASIMPTIIRGEINAAAIMIAEKGSDMIKKQWNEVRNYSGVQYSKCSSYVLICISNVFLILIFLKPLR